MDIEKTYKRCIPGHPTTVKLECLDCLFWYRRRSGTIDCEIKPELKR